MEKALSIRIDLSAQTLTLLQGEQLLHRYRVSTGGNGVGEVKGSGCTPRGRHRIRAKIGAGAPSGTVFTGRRLSPDIALCTPEALARYPGRDWILTRILWLSGVEIGKNRLGCVDTFRRYIYIHGTPDSTPLGAPGSKGCIRMRNADIIELFEAVSAGTEVTLHE